MNFIKDNINSLVMGIMYIGLLGGVVVVMGQALFA